MSWWVRKAKNDPKLTHNSLPLKVFDIHCLQECINFEIKLRHKIWNFASLYRSSTYSKDIFESFVDNLELNLDSFTANNSELILLLGDFDAEISTRYNQIKTA